MNISKIMRRLIYAARYFYFKKLRLVYTKHLLWVADHAMQDGDGWYDGTMDAPPPPLAGNRQNLLKLCWNLPRKLSKIHYTSAGNNNCCRQLLESIWIFDATNTCYSSKLA
jgi:hypothetical protein